MAKLDQAYGIHAIQSLLKSAPKKIVELYLAEGRQDQRMQKVVTAAQKQGIPIKLVDKKTLDSMSDGKHQGVFAYVMPGKKLDEAALYEMVQTLDSEPLILVLDGVTDPHNLGACMRSADASGVDAVVVPKDNSASLNDVARKVACGAAETVPLIPVTNLARSLKKLQELGLWVYGAAGEAEQTIYDATLSGPRVIVMGAEGDGMRRLTRETCDELIKIPMQGSVSSLNVSVATGVVLFEVLRQRLNR
ncbi:23S rRNA (guanosine(2251)-2'-O)-methyltransferase RlmB [Teredinibacter sp. KSP-S5-2]|uniref:23S rRNA (guanosine(2251)-2'-O)-methyltransferase RlmB n=1 Tax=Teredinibacter sp. KSP-S5-2 TaxID=3034506 RepID=UPI0029340F79|nr:23S rRNA (guanosine(2251)-2'-O)-methyltransferase RlmB [Teredinibacter sp. KSP-S5-2]WNO08151.1 23S rRNA (guanosine(2251)-2'-O)-methyltransferase RlmB [Teredinibacter sp. KSP-S5-2]